MTRRLLADGETPIERLPQAGRRPAGHLPARVGRARRRVVALLVRRRPVARHADRARRPGALARRSRPSACPPVATRWRRCARPSSRAAHAAAAGPAAADRRAGRLPRLRRGAPAGAAARARRGRPALPELRCCSRPTSRCSTTRDGSVLLIANAINYDATDARVDWAYDDAVARLDAMTADLPRPQPRRRRRSTPTVRAGVRPRPHRRERATRGRRAGQGGDPGRRHLPGRASASGSRCTTDGRPAGRLPRCCGPPTRARTCTCCASTGFDVVGSSPEALVKVTGGRAMHAPDRRHPAARRDPGGGRGARRRAARRPQGARRAPHARRPRPQRPRPGLRAGHASRSSTSCRSSGTATSCTSSRRSSVRCADGRTRARRAGRDASPPARCPARPRCGRWRSSRSSSRPGAGSTAACVGYLDFAGDLDMAIAIRTAVCATARATSRPAPASSPTPTRPPRTQECRNKADGRPARRRDGRQALRPRRRDRRGPARRDRLGLPRRRPAACCGAGSALAVGLVVAEAAAGPARRRSLDVGTPARRALPGSGRAAGPAVAASPLVALRRRRRWRPAGGAATAPASLLRRAVTAGVVAAAPEAVAR